MQTKDKKDRQNPCLRTLDFNAIKGLKRLIDLALEEDIASGDITTNSIISPDQSGSALITAKEPLLVAGLDIAGMVFSRLDPDVRFEPLCLDGNMVNKGDHLARVFGRLRSLLLGERTALNFLQRLSGVATNTRSFVKEAKGLSVKIVDTRKTTPGWRVLEKYAVRVGGAGNHRMGLFDGILIKDNHIAAAGGIGPAVRMARKNATHMLRIEVEAADMPQVDQALEAGADIIMLDNMNAEQISAATKKIQKKALVEVSGGITKKRIRELARAGVDILSCGALIHAARFVDISMNIVSDDIKKELRQRVL